MIKTIPVTILMVLTQVLFAPFQGLAGEAAIQAAVSILPQAYFVERVGGDRVSVTAMVEAGRNPHTFEPTPRQIASLSKANIYFRIGVPFETVWMHKFQQVNPSMKVVETQKDVPLRDMEDHHHDGEEENDSRDSHEEHEGHEEGAKDPHIWLDPNLVKIQAKHIADALCEIDPEGKAVYKKNLNDFLKDLDRLDAEIKELLKDIRIRKFLIFHPSWGYFADAYKLQQVPIELEGKEPTARQLAELLSIANKENLKTIFIQPQSSKRIADSIAKTLGGEAIVLDPLAKDYLKNVKEIAFKIKKALQ